MEPRFANICVVKEVHVYFIFHDREKLLKVGLKTSKNVFN